MRILVGCEKSQAVCKAFRLKGHEAYSNDVQECSGGHPEWHLCMDVFHALSIGDWDIAILHPDCTSMAVSGNAHYSGSLKRYVSVRWTQALWDVARKAAKKVCLENPVGVVFKNLEGGIQQYVQPFEFGHPESKRTGLRLWGLMPLHPTEVLRLPECGYWDNQTPSGQNKLGPSADRKEKRSLTYPGIAKAMAEQWG